MTRFEILCNYISAKQKAAELDNIANKLRYTATHNLTASLSELKNAWRGDASRAFEDKIYHMQQKILSQAASLKKDAEVIRTIAERTYQTEMKALEISQQRSYH